MERKADITNTTNQKELSNLVTMFRRFITWVGSIGYAPGDNEELKSHKAILTIGIYVSVLNLLTFFPVYIRIGRINAAITLIILAFAFTVNLFYFEFTATSGFFVTRLLLVSIYTLSSIIL